MSRSTKYFIFGFIFSLFSNPVVAQELPSKVSQLLSEFNIPQSAVSLNIELAGVDKPIVAFNSDIPRNPASVIKIVTTLSALELLGPNHVWTTRYWADGDVKSGVLNGDLVMQGGGDPFLTVDRFWHHVLSIRQRGVHTISGSLVIDNTLFDIPKHDRAAFDGQFSRLYNVGPDAALVNFSATRFVLHPFANRVAVFADPPLADLVVENKVKTASGKCTNKNAGWSYGLSRQEEIVTAKFGGSFKQRCGQHSIARSIVSNNEYTFRLFKQLWISSGGTFKGGYRLAKTPESAAAIISYPSEPLADVITSINKFSNNVMARQVFLSLDAQNEEQLPATLQGARNAVANWLRDKNINMPELYIANGSGLSRESKISSGSLSDLLQLAWESNYRPEFMSSLSISALDGTMRKRLKKSPVKGRARIKTGLINGVRSMAGFVNARSNKQYIVTMLIESKSVSFWNGNRIQDEVLEWVYNL